MTWAPAPESAPVAAGRTEPTAARPDLTRRCGTGRAVAAPDFRRLWASQTLSLVGSEVTQFALPLAAVALAPGRRRWGGWRPARFLPTLLLGLLVGRLGRPPARAGPC